MIKIGRYIESLVKNEIRKGLR